VQADFGKDRVERDADELVAGQGFSVGPSDIAFDSLDLPTLSAPIALPPDWMRAPLQAVRDALVSALLTAAACAALLIGLERGRLRALAAASVTAAAACTRR
jgi:hypothetical protein